MAQRIKSWRAQLLAYIFISGSKQRFFVQQKLQSLMQPAGNVVTA